MILFEREADRLIRVLNSSKPGCLIFAIYDRKHRRDEVMKRLGTEVKLPIHEFYITRVQTNPLELLQHLPYSSNFLISFYGIERASPEALKYLNQWETLVNPNWRYIFWITAHGRKEIVSKARAFWMQCSEICDFRVKIERRYSEKSEEKVVERSILAKRRNELVGELYLCKEIIDRYKPINTPMGKKTVALAMLKIGQIHCQLSKYNQSYKGLKEALSIYEELNDLEGLAIVYSELGETSTIHRQYEQALEWYEKSKEMFEKIKEKHLLALVLEALGLLYQKMDKKGEARKYIHRSYRIYLKLNLTQEAERIKHILDSF